MLFNTLYNLHKGPKGHNMHCHQMAVNLPVV